MDISPRYFIEDDDLDLLLRFTAYIELVISHARIDYLRRHDRHNRETSLEELHANEEPAYEDSYLSLSDDFGFEEDKLSKAFCRLNLLRRRILTLIFAEGLSAQETADRLNCSVDYVYLQKHRALKALRNQLMEGGGERGQ